MPSLPLNIDIEVGDGFDPSALPARAGVVAFESASGGAVQVASTGDVRAFVDARLGETAETGSRADLRPVTARVVGRTVGSALEGDLVCLELARERLPNTYRALADRWRAWFVQLDPDADAPTWRKTDLFELVGTEPAGTLLGPIADKDSAGRFGEMLDDAFELCRFPRELAKAPCGQACAYKEMGRCPAACDGSESMDAYRARVRRAIAFAAGHRDAEIELVEAEMRRAAEAQDFERATVLKDRLDALAAKPGKAWSHIGDMAGLGVLAVLPAERFGRARLVVLTRLGVTWIADVLSHDAKRAWEETEEIVRGLHDAALGEGRRRLDAAWAERIGLVSRHWHKPAKKGRRRRWTLFDLRDWPTPRAVVRAIGSASAAEEGDEEHAERALEGDAGVA
ncbi:MAG: UvrB/UvrC motif-containing protein [Phycisphaerales bacterium]